MGRLVYFWALLLLVGCVAVEVMLTEDPVFVPLEPTRVVPGGYVIGNAILPGQSFLPEPRRDVDIVDLSLQFPSPGVVREWQLQAFLTGRVALEVFRARPENEGDEEATGTLKLVGRNEFTVEKSGFQHLRPAPADLIEVREDDVVGIHAIDAGVVGYHPDGGNMVKWSANPTPMAPVNTHIVFEGEARRTYAVAAIVLPGTAERPLLDPYRHEKFPPVEGEAFDELYLHKPQGMVYPPPKQDYSVCPFGCYMGTCVRGHCTCQKGWAGVACDLPWFDCEPPCVHGQCHNGTCVCQQDWKGKTCASKDCPTNCGAPLQGTCDHQTGLCTCETGWQGDDCSIASGVVAVGAADSTTECPNNCSSHGVCKDGVCVCRTLWTGDDCNSPTCPHDCNGRGECVNMGTHGVCKCHSGYQDFDCSLEARLPLYAYFNKPEHYHILTTRWDKYRDGTSDENGPIFQFLGKLGFCIDGSIPGTLPLYEFVSDLEDHLYTTDRDDVRSSTTGNETWSETGVLCHVFPGDTEATRPLHRYYSDLYKDHQYMALFELLGAGKDSYRYEGILGFVRLEDSPPLRVPLDPSPAPSTSVTPSPSLAPSPSPSMTPDPSPNPSNKPLPEEPSASPWPLPAE